jgi:NADH-quinone oxidoreductase subunit C
MSEPGPDTRKKNHDSLTLSKLKALFGPVIMDSHSRCGDDTVIVPPGKIVEVSRFLKEDPELDYNVLIDITAVDYMPRDPRFEVVYHYLSLAKLHRVRVKVPVPADGTEVPSLTGLWCAADWLEREVWDMFGIRFSGHPDLRRILMYEGFEGHPLRKDYPIKKRQPLIE